MRERGEDHSKVEACVEETFRRVGTSIRLGAPLGLGKANHIVNEFYRRACDDPGIDLQIFTALSLAAPKWSNDLERRYIEPLAERLFGGYPELAYIDPVKRGTLPDNIRVTEFYFQPGAFLGSELAQRSYTSSNYTHAVRDLLDAGINVLAQAVGAETVDGDTRYSLSCNTDLTLDIVPRLRERERQGEPIALLAQVNRELPFMYGDAAVDADYFDAVLDAPEYEFPLFGVPNRPVTTADYMIGLHVSSLVRDGGTLQIGIGSLGDAVVTMLRLRHGRNDRYRAALDDAGTLERHGELVERIGGTGTFERGLYASSEMLVHGFLELYRDRILKRKVYNHAGVQRLLNEGRITEDVTGEMLSALHEADVVSSPMTRAEFEDLKALGILRPGVTLTDGHLVSGDGARTPADLEDHASRERIAEHCLGERLKGGHIAHACFFLGPAVMYEALREMEPAERQTICMSGISYVNELYGQEELKRVQRRDARFLNAGMVATLSGAFASDGLEDGRVVSGVGGQYNFVAMAHALEDGRSILMLPSTRESGGDTISNIRFSYGHTTIPRHLRDIVVTEYGIADLRGRSDEDVATRLIEIADSRFQEELISRAKEAGKISQDYELPDHARENTPERLDAVLEPHRARGLFDRFPFGTELTQEELVLKKALTRLKETLKGRDLSELSASDFKDMVSVPDSARPYLERMDLADPQGAKETLMQRAVVFALASVNAI